VEWYTFASQLAVLRNAPMVMMRLMKTEGSYLLIAKVLVISRLLHKALSQSKNKPPIVDQLWERLLSVRRKLLRRIDKRLASTDGESATLVESMSAYALATSSTPTDVLQHFHKIRMDRIVSRLKQGDGELAKHGISALKLCIQTCLDTQAIIPRRLADVLAKLKAHALVQDPDVRGLYELNLDVHDRWIGEEARNYTPQPRHDELQRSSAESMLHRWSKDAIAAFLKGVKRALEGEERLKEVASLRQELIETWLLSGSRMAGVKSTSVLDDMRDTMNEKLEDIMRLRTQGLKEVVSELTRRLETLSSSETRSNPSLWSTTAKSSDLSNGAQSFKSTILNTYQGRDQSVVSVTSAFDKWVDSVLEVKGIVKSMKEARWDDTFADDVDDESDDELGDSKQTLLSDDDPRLLEEATQQALSEALQQLDKRFSAIVDTSNDSKERDAVQQAAFILRVVREIGDRIPRLRLHGKSTTLASPFTSDMLQLLHSVLAAHIADPNLETYKTSLLSAAKAPINSHILWEGNPPLPSQPSPGAFRFLRELNKSMAELGSDLWASGSVESLKTTVFGAVMRLLEEQVDALRSRSRTPRETDEPREEKQNEGGDNAEEEAADEEVSTAEPDKTISEAREAQQLKLKQLLFDALYIERFVADGSALKDSVAELIAQADLADLDEAAESRLRKNAAEYAKKTYLLFALLA
jgi:hypothetical protein